MVRPNSDAKLFMSQTKFEVRPSQTIKTGSIDSHADLNSRQTKIKRGKNALGVKVLAIYFIVIYALGLAQEKFGV